MSEVLPSEFNFEADDFPSDVIVRKETVKQKITGDYSGAGTSSFSIPVNSPSAFIDPQSIKMYAKFTTAVGGAGNTLNGTDATDVLLNSSYCIFSSVSLSTGGGALIEQVSDAAIVGAVYEVITSNDQWKDGQGTHFAQQLHMVSRFSVYNQTLRIGAIELLGFTKLEKYVRLRDFGGLSFNFTLANPSFVHVMRTNAGTIAQTLSEISLTYDLIHVDSAFSAYYDQEVWGKGYSLYIKSITNASQQYSGTAVASLTFPVTTKRALQCLAVIREVAKLTAVEENSLAFMSQGFDSYQFQIDQNFFPRSPVNSYSELAAMLLDTCHERDSSECVALQTLNRLNLVTEWAKTTLSTGLQDRNGKCVLSLDLQHYSSNPMAGVEIGSQGLVLHVGNSLTANSKQVNVMVVHHRRITVSADSGVLIEN